MPSPPSRLPHLISSLTVLDSIYYTVNTILALRHVCKANKELCIVKLNRHSISTSQPHLSSSRVLHCGILSQSASSEAIDDTKHGIKTNNWRWLLYTLRNTRLRIACTSFASLPWLEDEKPKVDALLAMDFVALANWVTLRVYLVCLCVLSSSTLGSLHGCLKPNSHGLAKIASSPRYNISSTVCISDQEGFGCTSICTVCGLLLCWHKHRGCIKDLYTNECVFACSL